MILVNKVIRTLGRCYVDAIFSGANVLMFIITVILAAASWVVNGFVHALVAGSVLYIFLLTGLALAVWGDFWREQGGAGGE